MTSGDPAVRFWLRYAERSGALADDDGGVALLVLPPELRERHGLPEELSVTGDPDAARDDGALLLAPGQPVLEEAAHQVLGDGDVGVASVSRPASVPPSASVLEARARDRVPVDHGRIDVVREPTPVLVPVLRVGALVTYSVSLDQRFQERDEVWVDATTTLVVEDRVSAALADSLITGAGSGVGAPPCDLPAAAEAAALELERRAGTRLSELGRQSHRARGEELARADAYYEAALAGIARRQAAAPPERARLLAAQAEATTVERSRRVAEIEEKFRPRHEVRPFRLHLVLVPALRMAVHVRRGARSYPWELTWLLVPPGFAPPRCPSCRSTSPLSAGRQTLGCRACLS